MKASLSPFFDQSSSHSFGRQRATAARESSGALGPRRGFEVGGAMAPSRHRLADISLGASQSASPGSSGPVAQRQASPIGQPAAPAAESRGGLPADLKSGIESLSGVSMEGVRVHYNSPKPAQLRAEAYAQGKDIHIAPGRQEHLPHEAWHLAQQGQGRVQATMQAKGLPINDSEHLEKEADVMGAKALKIGRAKISAESAQSPAAGSGGGAAPAVAAPTGAAP